MPAEIPSTGSLRWGWINPTRAAGTARMMPGRFGHGGQDRLYKLGHTQRAVPDDRPLTKEMLV